jgi:hypothetical protein
MTLSAITPHLSSIASPVQMLANARSVAVTVLALYVVSNIPMTLAGNCEETEKICVKSCLGGGDGREAGACLLGCKLAHLMCKWFTKDK